MQLKELAKLSSTFHRTAKMPILFLGHGNPMNAISENEFVDGFRKISKEIQKPNAILCISAHWETKGTFVTAMQQPKTIHDFSGFPKELSTFQYPALGNPTLAEETKQLVKKSTIELDHQWGLDHGAWSVITHLYPKADVPVIQMSLDYSKNANFHFEMAKELAELRNRGVLIIGSGNIVHNLGLLAWNKIDQEFGYDWATEASTKIKSLIIHNEFEKLINYQLLGKAFELAIPTQEHYLPLLYILALKEDKEEVHFFNDKAIGGSLTMTSLKIETS